MVVQRQVSASKPVDVLPRAAYFDNTARARKVDCWALLALRVIVRGSSADGGYRWQSKSPARLENEVQSAGAIPYARMASSGTCVLGAAARPIVGSIDQRGPRC